MVVNVAYCVADALKESGSNDQQETVIKETVIVLGRE